MTMNEKDFFLQATVRICGSLEIEQDMMKCFLVPERFYTHGRNDHEPLWPGFLRGPSH